MNILMRGLCAPKNVVIGGTIFSHKRIYRATWITPEHMMEKQIFVSMKFTRSVENVRSRRGGETASSHQLVVVKMNLELEKN